MCALDDWLVDVVPTRPPIPSSDFPVLDVDERMLPLEELWQLPDLEGREMDVHGHLEICLLESVEHLTGEISVEHDVSFTIGVEESVPFFIEHQGPCDDELLAVEDDRVLLAELVCGVGVPHIDRHTEVDDVFDVDHA